MNLPVIRQALFWMLLALLLIMPLVAACGGASKQQTQNGQDLMRPSPTLTSAEEEPAAEGWVARYDGPAHGIDGASAIAVDGSGNVYVTGSSEGTGTGADYATIKYDTSGNQLWVARYDGPASGEDVALAIVVDGSGNVYVTGSIFIGPDSFSYDYATIKYDSDGNELWVAQYDGPAGREDIGWFLAVDDMGNVYVTGISEGRPAAPEGRDYATIKYDSNGNELWVARYDGPGGHRDEPAGIAVDDSGNVYVTGYSFGAGRFEDYATIKYDSAGNQLWVARYDGPTGGDDAAQAMVVDSSGNIYVTGGSDTTTAPEGLDYATIKYDSSGNQLWVARYHPGFINFGKAIAIDNLGNLYVTGLSLGAAPDFDYATVRYDSSGNEVWVARDDGVSLQEVSLLGNRGTPCWVAVDGSGNVYMSGVSGSSGTWRANEIDSVTMKYDSSGNQVWVAKYNCAFRDSAMDGSGNVYVTCASHDGDYTIIKYVQQ